MPGIRLGFGHSDDLNGNDVLAVGASNRDQHQHDVEAPPGKARRTEQGGTSPSSSRRSEDGAGGAHEEAAEGELGSEALAEVPPPMTPFTKEALVQLHERRDNLYRQLEEANVASLEFLDALKANITARLLSLQREIQGMCEDVEQQLMQSSSTTLDLQDRLAAARHLVQSLGITVTHRNAEQQE